MGSQKVMDGPLVSIVTAVFNARETVERTILSVINQTYKNIEYIIIDGKSTDGTLDVVEKYRDKIAIVVSEKDSGIADAMNKGINLANGELIGLINADDWFETDAVEKIVGAYQNRKDSVIHADMKIYSSDDIFYLERAPDKLNLNKGMVINHPTVFVPKAVYAKLGVFDTSYRIVFDWEFMVRLKSAGVPFVPLHYPISNFRVGGVSTNRPDILIEEMHRVRKHHGLYKMVDRYYLINKLRHMVFGNNLVKISQKLRLLKHKLKKQ